MTLKASSRNRAGSFIKRLFAQFLWLGAVTKLALVVMTIVSAMSTDGNDIYVAIVLNKLARHYAGIRGVKVWRMVGGIKCNFEDKNGVLEEGENRTRSFLCHDGSAIANV